VKRIKTKENKRRQMMKKSRLLVTATMAVLLMAGIAVAGKTSVEYGKELFGDAKLGGSTNESSCNSCHSGGKDLGDAGSNPKLSKAINKCITNHMAGSKIDGRKAEMRSLKMYIQSL
jgi:cytochrome c peroxidase